MDAADEPGGGRQGVRPQRHRHRAGVAAAAGEDELDPGHPGDRRHEPERRVPGGERRALLDMRLDEARRRTVEHRAGREGLPQPQRRERLAERDAVGVDEVGLVCLELAEERPRAEDAAPEPRALFEPEGDHRDRAPGAAGGAGSPRRRRGREDAEGAVEAAAVGRGVEMGSCPDLCHRRVGAGRAAEQVARAVDAHVEARLAHPAGHQPVGALLTLSQAGPVRAGVAADLEERVEPLDDAGGALVRRSGHPPTRVYRRLHSGSNPSAAEVAHSQSNPSGSMCKKVIRRTEPSRPGAVRISIAPSARRPPVS